MRTDMPEESIQNESRRKLFKMAGIGVAATLAPGAALAQLKAESGSPSLSLVRKGIDRALDVINPDLLEAEAKKVYSEAVYAFVTQGSGKQWTLRENQYAWSDWALNPHRMGGVVRDKIDTSVTLLGEKLPHPLLVTPFGSHGLHHPEAEVATARGAAMSGALACFSSASTASLEDIAKASSGPKWFQMYLNVDEGISREVLQRVPRAGFKAVILTIDAIGQASSDAYVRTGKARPWLPYGNFPSGSANAFKTNLAWSDVEMIRKITGLPVVVKGVTRPEDAVAAIQAGASAIQVSNHGGRALDGTPAAIIMLPSIADAVKGQVPIILDSGIRRGTDVAKALALGANAVAVGRPLMYALALGGAKGVDSLLKFLHTELVETMLHLGVSRLDDLGPSHVIAAPVGRHATAPAPARAISPRE